MKNSISVLLAILCFGCSSTIENAQSSLVGNWSIVQIDYSDEMGQNHQAFSSDGFFHFDSQNLAYEFPMGGE